MDNIKNWIYKNKYILFAIFSFLLFMTFIKPFDSDTYWHLKTGEWILSNGIPKSDPFSYWGGNFVAHEWLFDILIYLLYSFVGYKGFIFVNFAVIGIILYISMKLAEKKMNDNGLIFLIAPFFIVYGAGFLVMRPQLFSTLFLCIEIYLLENKKHYWLLPIMTVLLVNIHGGMSILMLVIYLIYLLFDIYERIPNLNKKEIIKDIVWLFAIMVALVVSPYGFECVAYGSKMPDYVKSMITEFFPLVKSSDEILIVCLLIFPLACMAYSKKTKAVDICMMSMGIISSIIWIRLLIVLIPIYLIYGIPAINDTLEDVCSKFVKKKKRKINYIKILNIFTILLTVFLCIFVVINVFSVSLEKYENEEREVVCAPTIIKNYIEENNIDVENNIMFNNYNFGGYFIFNDIPVFIDGRVDAYTKEYGSPDIAPDVFDMIHAKNNTLELIDKYNIKYFALCTNDMLTNYLLSNNLVDILIQDSNYIFLELRK